MILITGGTGTTGREVVKQLSEAGARGVRALVRDPAKASFIRDAGFEVSEGDFDRPETLAAALTGVERALLLTAPSPDTFRQQSAFVEAAKSAGLRHIVKLSAIGADATAPEGFAKWHGQAEDELKASGLAWTMLQPNFFMQNLLGFARTIASEGRIYQPTGDGRASFVDVRDIASVAVKALIAGGHEGRSYVITGPEALSYREVAEKLSAATGRQVTYVPITPAQFREGALAQGLPAWLVDALGVLNEVFASNKAALVTDAVREVAGREPTTFDQFARDYAQAFKGQQAGSAS
jgi:uncharacterized protein YbjT (DUF2867 family)